VLVNGGWHGDDENIAIAQVFKAGAELQVFGGLQFFSFGF
jgi:hypothetical protein